MKNKVRSPSAMSSGFFKALFLSSSFLQFRFTFSPKKVAMSSVLLTFLLLLLVPSVHGFDQQQHQCQSSATGTYDFCLRFKELICPGCNFYFFFLLIISLTTLFLCLVVIFRHERMPRFLKSDPIVMAYTLVSGLAISILAYYTN